MKTTYNHIAGQSVERSAALSDGIFGVAMTLLVLDLRVPITTAHTEIGLLHAIRDMVPDLLIYLMSFLTAGIFWVGQQTQLNHLKSADRHLTWLNLGFLFAVTLLPLSTRLLVDFRHTRTALLLYWGNILLLGIGLYTTWGWASRAGLLDDKITFEVQAAICRRIILAQSLYALGAALCIFSPALSIGAIVIIQLNYVLSPATWMRQQSA